VLAGPGRRVVGLLIDLAIWLVPQLVLIGMVVAVFIVNLDTSSSDESSGSGLSGGAVVLLLLLYALVFALGIARFVIEAELVARRGQTWGMRVARLRVVDARTGGPVTRGRAWGRAAFASFISGQLFGFGYWWAFFDDRRRALHDLVCTTVVIDER